MADLADGESTEVAGSGSSVYTIRNIGGVYSCSCPAWRNQSIAIESRTCKHIRRLRGDAEETARVGSAAAVPPRAKISDGNEDDSKTPPVLLAEAWDGAVDVEGWWISEKLDGVRAYWDGKQFLSRQGNRYLAPSWFTEGLPSVPLDGELWLDRKQFQRTVSIVRRQDQSEHWKQIRYVVFDAPSISDPFELRMEFLNDLFKKHGNQYVSSHAQERCRSIAHLKEELSRIESLGGEGLMLRQPASLYVAGRSSTLLKVKTFHDDEAIVIGHQPGAGRHKGRLGALLVKLPDGTEFSVGTGLSDAQRDNPPPIGTPITFRYQELSDGGVPRFPSFVGVRADGGFSDKPAKGPGSEKADATIRVSSKTAGNAASEDATAKSKKKSAAAATISSSSGTGPAKSQKRHFEFSDEKSDKFWEIESLRTRLRFGTVAPVRMAKPTLRHSPMMPRRRSTRIH